MTEKTGVNYASFLTYLVFVPFIYKGLSSGQYVLSAIAIICIIGSAYLLNKAFSAKPKSTNP